MHAQKICDREIPLNGFKAISTKCTGLINSITWKFFKEKCRIQKIYTEFAIRAKSLVEAEVYYGFQIIFLNLK